MTSMQINDSVFDLSFTYNIKDLQKPEEISMTNKGSIMGILQYTPKYSLFAFMVRLANLEGILGDLQANYTLFVPSNKYIERKYSENVFRNMDKFTARGTVLYHILNGKINHAALLSSRGLYLNTRVDPSMHATILSENFGHGIVLNNTANIIEPNIKSNNGLIHEIDDLLIPPDFVTSFASYRVC